VPQPTIDEKVGIPATQKKRMDECGMVKSLSLMRGCLEERRKRKKCTRGEARTHDLGFTNETILDPRSNQLSYTSDRNFTSFP
jgi:hypothetical protein